MVTHPRSAGFEPRASTFRGACPFPAWRRRCPSSFASSLARSITNRAACTRRRWLSPLSSATHSREPSRRLLLASSRPAPSSPARGERQLPRERHDAYRRRDSQPVPEALPRRAGAAARRERHLIQPAAVARPTATAAAERRAAANSERHITHAQRRHSTYNHMTHTRAQRHCTQYKLLTHLNLNNLTSS